VNTKSVFTIFVMVESLLILTGCAVHHPRFEDSNQLFLEQTIDKMDLGGTLRGKIPANSSVALVSMETETTLDYPIIAMIEDQLVKSLLSNGFKVMERDKQMVTRLAQERKEGTYSIIGEPPSGMAELKIQEDYCPISPLFIPIQLASADFIISYRIQEVGILYLPSDQPLSKFKKREGLVRLHIRIQNTKSGEVLFADNILGTKSDEIRSAFVGQLSDYHYSFFQHEYPLQPKAPRGIIKLVTKIREE